MTIKEAQERIDRWIKEYGVRYFNEMTNMAILTEEVGEVARIMARKYGEQSFKESEEKELGDELADVLWVLICIANQTGIDLTEALVITALIDGVTYSVTGTENASVWSFIDAGDPIGDIWVTIAFPNTPMDLSDLSVDNPDNEYQNAQAKMTFVVEAVQGNAQPLPLQ